jgi:hypothetical protein
MTELQRELLINLKTARALSLTILLQRATR